MTLKQIISKWHYSVKNVAGVMVLILCTLSDATLYLYQVSLKNILAGIKVIEQTRFSLEKFQRGIVPQKL